MPQLVIDAREASISTGLKVGRILPFKKRRMVVHFIFMDHTGPTDMNPSEISSMDLLPHPHIGLSTVSYLFSGQVTHCDNLVVKQIIKPGAVNWMTTGKGIVHSERFEDPAALAEGAMEIIQSRVTLPENAGESDPTFEIYQPEVLPVSTDKVIRMRLIAGSAYGLKNNVQIHMPMFFLHIKLDAESKIDESGGYSESAMYVVKGDVDIAENLFHKGQMVVFSREEEPVIKSNEPATLMMFEGEPLGDRFIWWNFVSSRKERIEQAKTDWKAGRIKLAPKDDKEFISLLEDKSRPSAMPLQAEPIS